MAILARDLAQITNRSGLARSGTVRSGAVGDMHSIYTTDEAPNHFAGEFLYTDQPVINPNPAP